MHCMVCDAEMTLIHVVQDDTMPVPGFERRTFICPACHDEERRLVFSRCDAEPSLVPAAPSDGQSESEPMPLMDTAPSNGHGTVHCASFRCAPRQSGSVQARGRKDAPLVGEVCSSRAAA
jgi:hypothetical protein